VLFSFPNTTGEKGGEETMLQIIGKEAILLPKVLRMDVSDITEVADGVYQRVLRLVTEEGILELSIEAKERTTICFASDPQIAKKWLPPEGITFGAGEEEALQS
jgi:hypothetical protein